MNTATARVIPFTGTRRKGPSNRDLGPGTGNAEENTPQRGVSLELIDRFDENRMHLEAFLEGIYNTALAAGQIGLGVNTILVFCTMAKARVDEMEKVFREITEEGGGEK